MRPSERGPEPPAPRGAARGFDAPDEIRYVSRGRIEIVTLDGVSVSRSTLDPGWRWSESLRSLAGTELCEHAHLGIVLSGRLRIVLPDGREIEAGAGDCLVVAPGHDAFVPGDETAIVIDFGDAADAHARAARSARAQAEEGDDGEPLIDQDFISG